MKKAFAWAFYSKLQLFLNASERPLFINAICVLKKITAFSKLIDVFYTCKIERDDD